MPPRLRIALALALVPIVIVLAWRWPGPGGPEERILLSGSLEGRTAALAFRVDGRIAALEVDEGERVARGQTVARLDDGDLKLAVARAEASLRMARATLARLEAGSRPEEIDAARARVDEARARLDFSRAEARRLADLVPRKLATKEQLDRAQADVRAATAVLEAARQKLALLQAGVRREDIDRARADVELRTVALAEARRRLAYARLDAPWAAVVSARLAEAGEVVNPGRAVLQIVDLAHPWVRAWLNARDLPRVRLGQTVEVRAWGVAEPLRGRLSFISPEAEFTPRTVETHALRVDRVHRVKVTVDNPDGELKIGMPVDVIIEPASAG